MLVLVSASSREAKTASMGAGPMGSRRAARRMAAASAAPGCRGESRVLGVLGRPALVVEHDQASPGHVAPGADVGEALGRQVPGRASLRPWRRRRRPRRGTRRRPRCPRRRRWLGRLGRHATAASKRSAQARTIPETAEQAGTPVVGGREQVQCDAQEPSGLVVAAVGLGVVGGGRGRVDPRLGSGEPGTAVILGGDLPRVGGGGPAAVRLLEGVRRLAVEPHPA